MSTKSITSGVRIMPKPSYDDLIDEWANFYQFMTWNLPKYSKFEYEKICDCDVWRGTVWVTSTDVIRTSDNIFIEFKCHDKTYSLKIDRRDLTTSLYEGSRIFGLPEIQDNSIKEFINAITDIFGVERYFE